MDDLSKQFQVNSLGFNYSRLNELLAIDYPAFWTKNNLL